MSLQLTFLKLKEKAETFNDPILTENIENLQKVISFLEEKREEEIDDDLGSFYGSMIITRNKFPRALFDGIQEMGNIKDFQKAKKEELPEIPFWVDLLPHVAIVICIILYLIAGVYMFRSIDHGLVHKPFHELILLPFMICSTVGWGHITPTVRVSRFFSIMYAIVGVPLMFAFLSNIGRIITDICTSDWKLLKWFSERKPESRALLNQLKLSTASSLFCVHMFIAIPLLGMYFQELTVPEALYFNFITIGCIGYGDIYPKPRNLFHVILMMIFFSIGIVFAGCFFVACCLNLGKFLRKTECFVDRQFKKIAKFFSRIQVYDK
ncbi:hypothetical protein FO519_008525 [Halicephalobus sp. NKZ332]|nr:hypothetical protein FO519_008525 [Halicephalobus sp. NKZ332]